MTNSILAKLAVLKHQSEILTDLKCQAIINHKSLKEYYVLDEIHEDVRKKQIALIKVS